MGALILGIILCLVAWLLPLPFPIPTILYIVGVIAILYGLWVLLLGGRSVAGEPTTTRRRIRWY